jgi:hypothetical protein
MSLVQLTCHTGTTRQPSNVYTAPTFLEVHLEDNQRVVSIEWRRGLDSRYRKTVDWTWTVWIETRC